MPLPKTADIGKIIRYLRRENPAMPFRQKLAIALTHARKYARGERREALLRQYRKFLKERGRRR